MVKGNICKKTLLVVLVLANILTLCCCSIPDGGTAASAQAPDELTEALKIANVYTQFLDAENDESAALLKSIEDAKNTAENPISSRENMDRTAADLLDAVNIFHDSYFAIDGNKTKEAELIKTLWVGNVKCAYDKKSRTFYYTMGTTPQRSFEFDFSVESGLNGSAVFTEILDKSGSVFPYSFVPELNQEYTLRAYSVNCTFDYKIIFTMLPVMQINDISNISDEYKNCVISVTDPDFAYVSGRVVSHLFVESTAKIHRRGGISRGFEKKSYSIKFVDETGANKDMSFFSMRNDSDWIIDAMYIDRARARNRVSTDLWHDMDSPLYYMNDSMKPQKNGTLGTYVEVFLNNEYIGLYCFTEKIDRKQLQLLKNNNESEENSVFRSVIYKGKAWGQSLLFKNLWDYSNQSSWWDAFEQKFPRPAKGGEIRWEPLYNFVKFFLESNDEELIANIDKYIDVQNFVDYALLMCISYAYDNTGKNAYWSVYDVTDAEMSKIFLTPWDLDSTWGRSWNGERVESTKEWMDSDPEHDTALFRRLVLTNAGGFADKLKQRWSELKNNVLSADSIVGRFRDYFELFDASGAWKRESARWPESKLNMETEIEYIDSWTKERWDYIDNIIMNELDTVDKFAPVMRKRRW